LVAGCAVWRRHSAAALVVSARSSHRRAAHRSSHRGIPGRLAAVVRRRRGVSGGTPSVGRRGGVVGHGFGWCARCGRSLRTHAAGAATTWSHDFPSGAHSVVRRGGPVHSVDRERHDAARGTGERSGAMAVFLSRCIARADQNALACWLPMGGVAARPGVTAARLPRCGSRGANLYGDQVRCGQRLAPWASAFRSLSPKLRARNLHARTPSRQYKVEARFAWRAGGGGADSKRGDCWSAAPPRGR